MNMNRSLKSIVRSTILTSIENIQEYQKLTGQVEAVEKQIAMIALESKA